jgi:sodium/potassium/calcium exchanger 6
MALVWIYMLANIIVDVLIVYELVSGVSAALLGLTLLSWGNSIGDAVASVAISRRGYGEMAMTGCVAGPVFNLLLGLGITTVRCNMQLDSHEITFDLDRFDTQVKLSVVTLIATIFVTVVLIWMAVINNFRLNKCHS